jgi:hypothetical protein
VVVVVVVGSEIAGIACRANQQRSVKAGTRLTNKVDILVCIKT